MILGGALALASLLFGWWFSYWGNDPSGSYGTLNPMALLLKNPSLLIYNISPVYEAGSPGIPLNETSLGMQPDATYFAIRLSVLLVLAGGILGIAGGTIKKINEYGIVGGVMVLLGVLVFVSMLGIRAGTGILFGSSSMLNASWGLGIGLFIAVASAIIMVVAYALSRSAKK